MDDSVLEGMRELLSCSICYKLFAEPKSLPCQHTFCKTCLANHIDAKIQEKPDNIMCPLCNLPISKEMSEETKTNFNYVSMIEKLQEKDKIQYCGLCVKGASESEAVGYCQDCQSLVCKHCVESHKRKKDLSQHGINPLREQEQLTLSTETKCFRHPQENLSLYCVSHDIVMCTVCAVLDHRLDCSVSYIDKKTVDNECQSVQYKLDSLRKLHQQMIEETAKQNNQKATLNSTHTSVLQQINHYHSTRKQQVDTETNTLLEQLNEWYKIHMKTCALQHETTASHVNNISDIINNCESIIYKQSTVETLIEKTRLSKQIDTLEKIENNVPLKEIDIKFIEKGCHGILLPNDIENIDLKVMSSSPTQNEAIEVQIRTGDDRKVNENIFTASINGESVDIINNDNDDIVMKWIPHTHIDQQVQVEISEYKVKQSITIPIKRSYNPLLIPSAMELPLKTSPLGVCLLSNNKMAVTSNGKKIKLIETTTFTDTDDEIDGNFIRPYFMAFDETQDSLWVTDREAHNIKRISLSNNQVTLQYGSHGAGYSQLSNPRGIAIYDNNRVYVSDMRNNRIVILNIQTNNTIIETSTIGQNILNQPSGIVFNNKGELAVCDDRNSRIALFSPNGKLIQYMGVGPSNIGLLCSPIGITVDKYGRYLISEFGSHCITAISPEGSILSCTRTVDNTIKEFTYPKGVAVDNNGHIYATDYGNKRIVKM